MKMKQSGKRNSCSSLLVPVAAFGLAFLFAGIQSQQYYQYTDYGGQGQSSLFRGGQGQGQGQRPGFGGGGQVGQGSGGDLFRGLRGFDYDFGRPQRQFPASSSSSSSSASGNGAASASASSRPVNFPQSPQRPPTGTGTGASAGASAGTGTALDPAIQAQFREIFDWNKDLTQDERFRQCTVPDIGDVERACPKRAFYFGLNPQHRRATGMVKELLTNPHNVLTTVCLAGAMRDLPGMNPNVWIRGMLGAHLSDEGLFDLQVPPMVEVMPHIFLNREYIQRAKRQGTLDPTQRRCTVVDGSVGADNGVENTLWYFREDVQVNSFHLNWHLIYPFTGVQRKADRQGELFYFSHHSHLARYHAERLSNGLRPVVPLNLELNMPVPDGYNPHLDDTNSGMRWGVRRPFRPVQDTVFINITGVPPNISVSERSLHVRRVEDSIRAGSLILRDGRRMPLDSRTGIDILGDVIEASVFSPNGDYYGTFGFHNEGHVLLSLIENPLNMTATPPGVMIEVATSMRDPVFYAYHTAMDQTFDLHKQQLPPYQLESGELPLKWEGVQITGLELAPDEGISNGLTTFFGQRTFEMTRGLDFNRSNVQGTVSACVTHLDHNPFSYRIFATRHPSSTSGRATVRIFMAPRFDENGRRYRMADQRKHFFMMDLFTVQLQPGVNRITRRSRDSALTIDVPQNIDQIQSTRPDRIRERPRTYCGCGWPHHLLLPRGTERGMQFDVFVMITNGDEDYVAPVNPRRRPEDCKPAPIYCGRLNDTYPDSRPMGYPFDRVPYSAARQWWERPRIVETLEEYVSGLPNAGTTTVTITHLGKRPGIQENTGNEIDDFTEPQGQGQQGQGQQTQGQFPSQNQGQGQRPIQQVPGQGQVQFPDQYQNQYNQFGFQSPAVPASASVPTQNSAFYPNSGDQGLDFKVENVPLLHQEHGPGGFGGDALTTTSFQDHNGVRFTNLHADPAPTQQNPYSYYPASRGVVDSFQRFLSYYFPDNRKK